MELWMFGLALSALVTVAARDARRAGDASAAGLTCLRVVGGLGLGAMAVLALGQGHHQAALVAAVGAAPLLGGLLGPGRARSAARPAPVARVRITARRPGTPAATDERQAA